MDLLELFFWFPAHTWRFCLSCAITLGIAFTFYDNLSGWERFALIVAGGVIGLWWQLRNRD